jgi:thiamine pyrophosphokinase
MQVLVLADGDVGPRAAIDAAWPGWLGPDVLVVAADGGARHAVGLGVTIQRWVGDGDSLGDAGIARLRDQGVDIDRRPFDKDETDMELALGAAISLAPEAIVVVGALGGARVDHALANVGLLTLSQSSGCDVRLIAADARVRLLQGPAVDGGPARIELDGHVGDIVSLLPVGADADGITTDGLRFPLIDEALVLGRTRGLSNIREMPTASITLRLGRLLIVETPATLST